MDAFDADVLIYACVPSHELGRRIRALFPAGAHELAGVGSVLLIPELLTKPLRNRMSDELNELGALLARLSLRPVDLSTARLATSLAASYGLNAIDAVHLACAVAASADRFVTNNVKDFPKSIVEIDITYPTDLADPEDP
ncbi:MAG: type II toxin-antitoxin system VapC family toxin [Acidimicrobiia bacterium]